MKPIQFRHGWVISEGLGGKIASFQLVSTLPVPFSSDFDTIVKIAILYIKDEAYSFLSWLGDFRGFRRGNSVFSLVFISLSNVSTIFIRFRYNCQDSCSIHKK